MLDFRYNNLAPILAEYLLRVHFHSKVRSMADITPDDVLKQMQVRPDSNPSNPTAVYVLGCFDQQVTVYSQQIRALNLIYALFKTEKLKEGREVAIIGAGAAGLTAAAAALVKGCKVTILEKQNEVLTIFNNNNKRWLHPHIYDWPAAGSENNDAQLPVLNWTANNAYEVVKVLKNQWAQFTNYYKDELEVWYNTTELEVSWENSIKVKWAGYLGQVKKECYDLPVKKFDVLIVAVGLGIEDTLPTYWNDGSLDISDSKNRRFLIIGCGDGGLVDLLRIKLVGFEHEKVVKEFLTELTDTDKEALTKIDTDVAESLSQGKLKDEDVSTQLWEKYNQLYKSNPKIAEIRDKLRKRLSNSQVCLSGTTDLPLTLRSSILSRFLVFCLFKIDNKIRYKRHKFTSDEIADIKAGKTLQFNGQSWKREEIILRIGPQSAIDKLEFLQGHCEHLKKISFLKQTHRPVWQDESGFWQVPKSLTFPVSSNPSQSVSSASLQSLTCPTYLSIKCGKEITPVDMLKDRANDPQGFLKDFYLNRPDLDGSLYNYVKNGEHVIILGKALTGKSRAVLELLNKEYPDSTVFLYDNLAKQFDFEAIPLDRLFELAKVSKEDTTLKFFVFDDIDKFANYPGFANFVRNLLVVDQVIILATCRQVNFPAVEAKLDKYELKVHFQILRVAPITDKKLKTQLIAQSQQNTKKEELIPDDTIGSYFLPLETLKVAYQNLEKSENLQEKIQLEILRSYKCLDLSQSEEWVQHRGNKRLLEESLRRRLSGHSNIEATLTPANLEDAFKQLAAIGFTKEGPVNEIFVESAYLEKIIAD
jgi:FAD binding domain